MIILNGLGIVDEFEVNGAWTPFTDINPGPLQNKQAYFDSNKVEYAVGSGPAPLLGAGASLTNFINPLTGVVSTGTTSIPVTSPANITPVSSNGFTDLINSLPGASTIQTLLTGTIFGLPNWVLLLGVASYFFMTEPKGRFGK